MNQYRDNMDADYQQNITFNELKSDSMANYNQQTNQNSEDNF